MWQHKPSPTPVSKGLKAEGCVTFILRLNDLPLTKIKLAIAKTLYTLTRPFCRSEVRVIQR